MTQSLDFKALAADLLQRADTLVPQWLPAGKRRGHEWVCGDLHGAAGESCSVNLTTGVFADFAADIRGGDLIALYAAINGCSQLEAARDLAGEPRQQTNGHDRAAHERQKTIVDTYDYRDARGQLLYQVVRYEPKNFAQRRPKDGGGWEWSIKGLERVLYRLPEVLQAIADKRVIWIPEGERDVHSLEQLGCCATTNAGGASKGNWRKHAQYSSALRGANVAILPDNDEPGRVRAGEIAHSLSGVAAKVRILQIPAPSKDITDWIGAGGTIEQLKELLAECAEYKPRAEDAPVTRGRGRSSAATKNIDQLGNAASPYVSQAQLALSKNGNDVPFENLDNVVRILAQHPSTKGAIWYDTFRSRVMTATDGIAREWTDHDDLQLLLWLQRDLALSKMGLDTARNGLNAYAATNKRDELKEWIESLEWDRIERIPKFMADAYGCAQDEYHAAVGRCWLISMVARALDPGCQVDTMTVLCGAQGLRKSSSLEKLVGREWHAAISQEFGNRDWLQSIEGKWLIEVPDLSGFIGRDLEHIKAIITTREDRYCKRYSRRAETVKRRSVLVATTNSESFLGDLTGARRFLPVTVTDINIDYIEANRIQLFAEAVSKYRTGACWWDFPMDIAIKEQEARRMVHPFEYTLEAWLSEPGNIQLSDDNKSHFIPVVTLLKIALEIPTGRQSGPDSSRVSAIMHRFGFRRGRVTYQKKQIRAFIQDIVYKDVSLPVSDVFDKELI